MARDLESLLARRAVARGLLEGTEGERLERGETTLHALVTRACLSASSLEALLAEVGAEMRRLHSGSVAPGAGTVLPEASRARPSDAPTLEMSAGAGSAAAPPGRSPSPPTISVPPAGLPAEFSPAEWGRYQDAEFIAEGGMGRVYRVHDRVLQRTVALKFLTGESPEHARRFLKEAQIQARVESPNICRIYEAGEMGGRPFIAMQYVEGKTLDAAAAQMTPDQKLRLLLKVAEAVHAAHRLGLIHRDLKPSNIMVEPSEEGSWEPYVMDFGLARELSGPSLTQSGIIVGTPSYMAPEQTRGEASALDRRTDVYSLGATAYELLSGKPPFEGGSSLDILRKVAEENPVPLERLVPSLPTDVETIVMKCLEKEPQRRYDSAKALADDIRRYLDGEPIEARRASWSYRARVKARKHKALVGVSAAGTLAVLVLAGLWGHSRLESNRRTRLAQEFGQEVERTDAIMRVASLLPPHDTRPERESVRRAMGRIEEQMRSVGRAAAGPGAYALGRGRLALHDYDGALDKLQRAWDSGYTQPEVAYALGLALGGLYRRELDRVEAMRNKEAREAARARIESRYRNPAVDYLRRSRGAEQASPEYAEGLIALYERDYTTAVKKAREAFTGKPWLYEAELLEADALILQGRASRLTGDAGAAEALFLKGERVLERAALTGRSDPRVYLSLGELWLNRLQMRALGTGESAGRPAQSAEAAYRTCLVVDPGNAEAWYKLSVVHRTGAEYAIRQGQDPTALLDAMFEEASRARDLAPSRSVGWYQIGASHTLRAQYESQRGADPYADFQKAVEGYRKALDIEPGSSTTLNALGMTYWFMGVHEYEHGRDPSASLDAAIGYLTETRRLTPNNLGTLSTLLGALNDKAAWEASRGKDPGATLGAAQEVSEAGLSINPKSVEILNNAGMTCLYRAEYELSLGRDPTTPAETAIAFWRRGLEVNPGLPVLSLNLACAHSIVARWRAATNADPSEAARQAGLAMAPVLAARALELNARSVMAQVSLAEAEFALGRGASPERHLKDAESWAEKALATDPHYSAALSALGSAEILRARWLVLEGRSPRDLLDRTTTRLEEGTKSAPSVPQLWTTLAQAHLLSARAAGGQNARARSEVEAGLAASGEARKLNPVVPEATAVEAALMLERAKLAAPGAARKLALSQAESGLSRALEANPLLERDFGSCLRECREMASAADP